MPISALFRQQSKLNCAPAALLALTVLALAISSCQENGKADSRPGGLSAALLVGSTPFSAPFSMQAFAPGADATMTAEPFYGVLKLDSAQADSHLEVITDWFNAATNQFLQLRQFPPFEFRFISDDDAIIPVLQTPQRSEHPYWEIILQPGRSWREPGDGPWSRASLPFAFKERNQNCVHNGVMTFLYRASGSISRVAWQISSETCQYLKANMWGLLRAEFRPGPAKNEQTLKESHRNLRARRLPVRPIADLARDYTGTEPAAFLPPGAEPSSVHGFVIDGIHYRGECATRHGPYPYCDVMVLPSYSLAKSLFAGLGYLYLQQRWPELADARVTDLVPQCRLPDGRWNVVSLSHLVNMRTGNYDSAEFHADEESAKMKDFFLADSHQGKIEFACSAWPRQSEPGTAAVYHSTDHYLLGTAMSEFVDRKSGVETDLYMDLLYPAIYRPLALSPLLGWTQRSYDEVGQAFTAFGLLMTPDDTARIGAFLNSPEGHQGLFDPDDLARALMRGEVQAEPAFQGRPFAYRNGFWGTDLGEAMNCSNPAWIAMMSGYGGITVALLPNQTVYYNFSDDGEFGFVNAATEAHKIRNICD